MFVIFCGQLGILLSSQDKASAGHPFVPPFLSPASGGTGTPGARETLPHKLTVWDRVATLEIRVGVGLVLFGLSLIKSPTPSTTSSRFTIYKQG